MSLELILWIVAGIIVWEIIFFLFEKYNRYLYNRFGSIEEVHWSENKFYAFLLASTFMGINGIIVFANPDGANYVGHYGRLLYEAGIILFGFMLYHFNKRLSKYIRSKNDRT